jgi:hypothetical protein
MSRYFSFWELPGAFVADQNQSTDSSNTPFSPPNCMFLLLGLYIELLSAPFSQQLQPRMNHHLIQ